jgi:uncharacterized membrane protein (DUF4010 family)
MAALFQVVLFVVAAMRRYFGSRGLMVSGAVLGLTDVDALTISMTKLAAVEGLQTAAQAIAVGILSNCLMKAVIAVALGSRRFGLLTAALLATMAAAIGVSIGLAL